MLTMEWIELSDIFSELGLLMLHTVLTDELPLHSAGPRLHG